MLSVPHVGNGVGNGSSCPPHKHPLRCQETSPTMLTKVPDQTPTFALCPGCHLPLDPRQCFNVDFCMPAHLPPPLSMTPANHAVTHYRRGETAPAPPPPPPQPANARPPSSLDPPDSNPPPSPEEFHDAASSPPSSPTRVASPTPSVHNKERCSSASTEYSFSDRLSINSELEAVLQQTAADYFPHREIQVPASLPISSPSTESSLIPSTSGEPVPLPVGRHWVVF